MSQSVASRPVPAISPGEGIEFLVGSGAPLGATPASSGVNFSVFSKHAQAVDLLLFDHPDDAQPSRVMSLDPAANRTYHYWHVFVSGLRAGQVYGYRVDGPFDPDRGMRFDRTKLLLDPYGRGVAVPNHYERTAAAANGEHFAAAMKSVVIDPGTYDWEGDRPLKQPSARTVIYEMHVRGFTRHPSSGVAEELRGTFAGLIQKIPYLRELGVTAVELLPVFQFDPQDAPRGLVNYWGYQPVSFSGQSHLNPLTENLAQVIQIHGRPEAFPLGSDLARFFPAEEVQR